MNRILVIPLLLLGLLALAPASWSGEANLTRFGPQTYNVVSGDPAVSSRTFRAVAGPASLVLRSEDGVEARVSVNGRNIVVEPDRFDENGRVRVPLTLERDNTIEVSVLGEQGAQVDLRVNQLTTANFNVRAKMYFGINTSDMEAQRDFYSTLGLTGEIFPAGPEECRSFARSLGFDDNYRIFVALTSLDGAPPWIDTVEFRDRSLRDDPPYANLNHIGMAYATYATTDLVGDYFYLKERGVDFVSPPTTAPNGERFVFLRDQDGTFLKLLEEPGMKTEGPDLTRLINTNMNVADLQRSVQFYRMLGFTERKNDSQMGSGQFAVAHSFAFGDSIAFRGVDVSLPGTDQALPAGGDPEATLQLRQWRTPFNGAPPYWAPVNHLGIDRIAFYVDDLNAAVDEMNRLGFEQIGPIGGGGGGAGSIAIAFFYDPDGIKVEFWGPLSAPNPDSAC